MGLPSAIVGCGAWCVLRRNEHITQQLSEHFLAGALLDLDKLYGRCSLPLFLAAGKPVEFTLVPLLFWPGSCIGRWGGGRSVVLSGMVMVAGVASTGLLPGDPAATSFARALLFLSAMQCGREHREGAISANL